MHLLPVDMGISNPNNWQGEGSDSNYSGQYQKPQILCYRNPELWVSHGSMDHGLDTTNIIS